MSEQEAAPKSPAERGLEAIIRTAPMPRDSNANGDIFGGWILSHMDIAAGVLASKRAKGRIATVAIDAMTFHKPVYVGDLVSIYGDVIAVGRTSIKVRLETWVERQRRRDGSIAPAETVRVTEGTFIMVAIDDQGRPRPVPEE